MQKNYRDNLHQIEDFYRAQLSVILSSDSLQNFLWTDLKKGA